jgi:hypothetical protein
MSTKISALPSSGAISDADVLPIVQSTTTNKVTVGSLYDYVSTQSSWRLVSAAKYTATPTSTTRLAMSDTSVVAVGLPLRYTITGSATVRYGVISALSANSYIDVAGVSLSADLTSLYVGQADHVHTVTLSLPGLYAASSTSTKLASIGKTFWKNLWRSVALCQFYVYQSISDGGANQPNVNLMNAGTEACSENTNNGPIVPAAGTPGANAGATIVAAQQILARGTSLEVKVTAGSTGDAQNLTVIAVFVTE